MLSEHSVIIATEKINENVDKGCRGVIVYMYNNGIFEVEFFDDNRRTISVNTVSRNQISELA
jgi:intein/homing endonuclease